jgi:hypothetical protein
MRETPCYSESFLPFPTTPKESQACIRHELSLSSPPIASTSPSPAVLRYDTSLLHHHRATLRHHFPRGCMVVLYAHVVRGIDNSTTSSTIHAQTQYTIPAAIGNALVKAPSTGSQALRIFYAYMHAPWSWSVLFRLASIQLLGRYLLWDSILFPAMFFQSRH